MRALNGSVIVAFAFILGGVSPANAQSEETIKKVERMLAIKQLKGTWIPDLLMTTKGAEKYPLAGRAIYFDVDENQRGDGKDQVSGEFARREGNRVVASGKFKIEDGFLKLTVEDSSPWDLEAGKTSQKLQYAYRIDGDVLTLCYSPGNKGKAKDLMPGKGKQIVVYRRESPDQKQSGNPKQPAEPTAAKSVAELIEALKHKGHETRANAGYALADLGPKARPALPALIAALDDRNEHVRDGAAYAIGEIGPGAITALPKLIRSLSDRAGSVRQCAARSIGKIGPEAKAAVPSLIKLLEDKDSGIRAAAARASGALLANTPSLCLCSRQL